MAWIIYLCSNNGRLTSAAGARAHSGGKLTGREEGLAWCEGLSLHYFIYHCYPATCSKHHGVLTDPEPVLCGTDPRSKNLSISLTFGSVIELSWQVTAQPILEHLQYWGAHHFLIPSLDSFHHKKVSYRDKTCSFSLQLLPTGARLLPGATQEKPERWKKVFRSGILCKSWDWSAVPIIPPFLSISGSFSNSMYQQVFMSITNLSLF